MLKGRKLFFASLALSSVPLFPCRAGNGGQQSTAGILWQGNEMKSDGIRSHIWGVTKEQAQNNGGGGAYVGVSLGCGMSVQFLITPDEARAIAAELTAAANLAAGGKA